jgi:hypothetical protein
MSTEARTINKEQRMTEDHSIDAVEAGDDAGHEAPPTVTFPDPEYPDIPYPIYRPARGSPYYIDPRTGWESRLSPPGTPPMTSEDVRRALEDFP